MHLKTSHQTFIPFDESNKLTEVSSGRELVEVMRSRNIDVCLVSGGFHRLIDPAANRCGITRDHIIANTLLFDKKGLSGD